MTDASTLRRERQRPGPATYLITFSCYGAHLPGQESTVDHTHNVPGTRRLPEERSLIDQSLGLMKHPPYCLDALRRKAVLDGIQEACRRRAWSLLAAHVRMTHVHAVVQADCSAEKVLGGLKAYATRALNERGLDNRSRPRWARHGSTRYLWTREAVENAVRYVVGRQGDEMAVYPCAS
jgi:REP element-mobilizing transposase RayT